MSTHYRKIAAKTGSQYNNSKQNESNSHKLFCIAISTLHIGTGKESVSTAYLSVTIQTLFLDYVSGGELFTHLCAKGNLDLPETRFYIGELVIALDHLHKVQVYKTVTFFKASSFCFFLI